MEKVFLKKYYDKSGTGAESFDQAITINRQGKPYLTAPLQQKEYNYKNGCSWNFLCRF